MHVILICDCRLTWGCALRVSAGTRAIAVGVLLCVVQLNSLNKSFLSRHSAIPPIFASLGINRV